ncbi:glycosyltransferase, partial [Patescibacteria group bacterium]
VNRDYIFCVGRIEPRKNQLSVIKAVEKFRKESNEDAKLVFVGKKNALTHPEYTLRFNYMLKKHPWITYVERVPYKDMPSYYSHSKVCVSASWFETTGLTLLEVLFCGANAVASSPRAKEILGKYASYCKPWDIDSIKEAIGEQFYANRPKLDVDMRQEYTWENAAKKTYRVYEELLEKK